MESRDGGADGSVESPALVLESTPQGNDGSDDLVAKALRDDLNTTSTRRLQGACDGYEDDPNGALVTHGVTCQQVVALGCDTDLHAMQPELPEGSLVSMLCPVSCNACQRTGMAKWIEASEACPWSKIDGECMTTSLARKT